MNQSTTLQKHLGFYSTVTWHPGNLFLNSSIPFKDNKRFAINKESITGITLTFMPLIVILHWFFFNNVLSILCELPEKFYIVSTPHLLPELLAAEQSELLTPGEVLEGSVTQTQLPGYSCHSHEQSNLLKLLKRKLS